MAVFHRKYLLISALLFSFGFATAQQAVLSGDVQTNYEQGLELFQKGQYGNAQRLFDKVAEKDYTNDREKRASASYYAAVCAMKLYNSDADMRVDDFAETYELSPLVNRLYFEYANYRFSLKRYRDAAEYYDKVDRFRLSDKKLDEYYFKKAYSLLSSDQPDEAKPLFFQLKDKESKYASSAQYYYAHLLYADSNYTEALTNFLPLRDDESFGPLVPYYLAQIYYKLNNYEKLLEVGEELIENATPSRAPEIAKLMGDAFYSKGDYVNALKYLQLYREEGGRMLQRDHFQLGYSQYKSGRIAEAINSFNKIVGGAGPDDLQQIAWYHLGDAYLQRGDKQKARTAFKAASEITVSPTIREDAYFNYAKLAYELSDPFQDAITTLNSFLDEFPNSPHRQEVNRYLANLYVTTKDYERALLAIERTGLNSPEMREAYQKIAFFRGTELFNSMKYAAALERYKESLKYNVNPTIAALAHYWIGETQYQLKNYEEALEAFEAFRESPGAFSMSEYDKSFYQTGYAHYKKLDFQKASNDFRTFTREAKPGDTRLPDAYLRLADSYLMTGGYLVAADFYSSAIKTHTKDADYALFQRSKSLGLADKRQEKIGELQQLINKYPHSAYAEEAQYEIANTHLLMENYDKAIKEFDDFIANHPDSRLVANAKLQKGLAYSNTGRNNQAIDVFKSVVEAHPGTEEAVKAVSLARVSYNRENRMSEYLDWVEDLNFVSFEASTLDSTAFGSAFDQYSEGNCEEAIKAFQDYLKRFPKGIFALKANYYSADCGLRTDRRELATKSYENILEFDRNDHTAEALEYVADKALREEDFVEANDLYTRLSQLSLNSASMLRAHTGLMQSAYALGDYAEAANYAGQVLQREGLSPDVRRKARRVSALSSVEQENWAEAMPKLDTLIATSGGEIKAEAYYHKGMVLNKQEEYEESNNVIYKMVEELPGFKEWKMRALILSAKNYWRQDDIFQANYTLDFVISSAHSPEITQQAQELKDRIALEERAKAEQRKKELQQQSDSVILNADDGMMIIDQGEEETDTTQTR